MRFSILLTLALAAALLVSGCGAKRPVSTPSSSTKPYTGPRGTKPYTIRGETYYPYSSSAGYAEEGLASWYGDDFHGKPTASGATYNMYAMTAAHKLLPLGTRVRVRNLTNGRTAEVLVNDRGPFVRGRIIDLSYSAAKQIGLVGPGVAKVYVEALSEVPRTADGGIAGEIYVQVGSFTVRANAEATARTLTSLGQPQRIVPAVVGGQQFYRVQAGPYPGTDTAKRTLTRLESRFPASFLIAE